MKVPVTILQCAGQRQQRSGTSPTKQQFIVAALSAFLLRKFGRRWDSTPVPVITVADLDPEAFKRFLMHAARSERMPSDALTERQARGVRRVTSSKRLAIDRQSTDVSSKWTGASDSVATAFPTVVARRGQAAR